MQSATLSPKRTSALRWSIAIAAAAAGIWTMAVLARLHDRPGDSWGLAFGWTAAALYFSQAFYARRRVWMAWPFSTARQWLQFHIYGGCIACLLAFLHAGARTPGGWFGWALVLATLCTTISGLMGIALQKRLPPRLAAISREEIPYERLPEVVQQLRDEADGVVEGGGKDLDPWYRGSVRPFLSEPRCSFAYVWDDRRARQSRLHRIQRLAPAAAGETLSRLQQLGVIVDAKISLDARASLQRILRSWPAFHVPPSVALLGLIAWHLLAVWYY
jgi:hypothetical protein